MNKKDEAWVRDVFQWFTEGSVHHEQFIRVHAWRCKACNELIDDYSLATKSHTKVCVYK